MLSIKSVSTRKYELDTYIYNSHTSQVIQPPSIYIYLYKWGYSTPLIYTFINIYFKIVERENVHIVQRLHKYRSIDV